MVTGSKASCNDEVHSLFSRVRAVLDKKKVDFLEVDGVANVIEEKVSKQLRCIAVFCLHFYALTNFFRPIFFFLGDSSKFLIIYKVEMWHVGLHSSTCINVMKVAFASEFYLAWSSL